MKPIKLLLDTDIGDDIDDAFGLAFSYFHPKIELVGVTTVFRDTKARAQQVIAFFDSVGEKNIPVRVGVGQPIKEEIHYFKNDDLNKTEHVPCQYSSEYEKYEVDEENALDFIYKMANTYEGELIIAPIGPLTNIALAIKKYPDLKNKIKKIVLMGGWFTEETPEWNILCDPEAADIVFNSGIEIYAVGLDVTLKCPFDSNILLELRRKEQPFQKLLIEWFDKWKEFFNFDKSVLHDPLAIATIIDEDVCSFEKKNIKVNLDEQRGVTKVVKSGEGSLINVATKVDFSVFNEHFKKSILK